MKKIKKDFITELLKTGMSETDAKKIFDLFIENIIKGVMDHQTVNIKNFGIFQLKKKKKTSFLNPKTKQMSLIKRINRVKFKPSRNVTKYINREEWNDGIREDRNEGRLE